MTILGFHGNTERYIVYLHVVCKPLFIVNLSDQKLEAIYALLEAFGNVSTPVNNNASRFTLLFSMDFDSAGFLTSAAVQVSLEARSFM